MAVEVKPASELDHVMTLPWPLLQCKQSKQNYCLGAILLPSCVSSRKLCRNFRSQKISTNRGKVLLCVLKLCFPSQHLFLKSSGFPSQAQLPDSWDVQLGCGCLLSWPRAGSPQCLVEKGWAAPPADVLWSSSPACPSICASALATQHREQKPRSKQLPCAAPGSPKIFWPLIL